MVRSSRDEYFRLPLQPQDGDETEPKPVRLEVPEEHRPAGGGAARLRENVGVSGDILWFAFERRTNEPGGRPELRGYDAAAKRWTAPLPLPTAWYGGRGASVLANAVGSAFAVGASEGKPGESLVYRYDAVEDAWKQETVPLPPAPVSPAAAQSADAGAWYTPSLLAATDADVWLLTRPRFGTGLPHQEWRLWRWSRSERTRTAAELPEGLAGSGLNDARGSFAGGRLYIGQQYAGLWAFDPATGKWDAPTIPAAPQADPDAQAATNLVPIRRPTWPVGPSLTVQSIAAGEGAVWASVRTENSSQTLIGRLDPQTHAWTLWNDDELPGLQQF